MLPVPVITMEDLSYADRLYFLSEDARHADLLGACDAPLTNKIISTLAWHWDIPVPHVDVIPGGPFCMYVQSQSRVILTKNANAVVVIHEMAHVAHMYLGPRRNIHHGPDHRRFVDDGAGLLRARLGLSEMLDLNEWQAAAGILGTARLLGFDSEMTQAAIQASDGIERIRLRNRFNSLWVDVPIDEVKSRH